MKHSLPGLPQLDEVDTLAENDNRRPIEAGQPGGEPASGAITEAWRRDMDRRRLTLAGISKNRFLKWVSMVEVRLREDRRYLRRLKIIYAEEACHQWDPNPCGGRPAILSALGFVRSRPLTHVHVASTEWVRIPLMAGGPSLWREGAVSTDHQRGFLR